MHFTSDNGSQNMLVYQPTIQLKKTRTLIMLMARNQRGYKL